MAKVKRPLISEDDSAVMRRVIGWCSAQGLDVRRTSPSQIEALRWTIERRQAGEVL